MRIPGWCGRGEVQADFGGLRHPLGCRATQGIRRVATPRRVGGISKRWPARGESVRRRRPASPRRGSSGHLWRRPGRPFRWPQLEGAPGSAQGSRQHCRSDHFLRRVGQRPGHRALGARTGSLQSVWGIGVRTRHRHRCMPNVWGRRGCRFQSGVLFLFPAMPTMWRQRTPGCDPLHTMPRPGHRDPEPQHQGKDSGRDQGWGNDPSRRKGWPRSRPGVRPATCS